MFDDMERFKRTFIEESYELLEDMEQRLVNINIEQPDVEDLNAVFRCAHSIKGGAGGFGFNALAALTHGIEEFLDRVRGFEIAMNHDLIDALLSAADLMRRMVDAADNNADGTIEGAQEAFDALQAASEAYASDTEEEAASGLFDNATDSSKDHQEETAFGLFDDAPGSPEEKAFGLFEPDPTGGSPVLTTYSISFKPHANFMATGNEPFLILRELHSLGDAVVTTDSKHIPDITTFKSDVCYISWNIILKAYVTKSRVEEVFEFVDNCSDITIIVEDRLYASGVPVVNNNSTQESEPKKPKKIIPAKQPIAASSSAPPPSATIRVEVDKVDRLVNMVGELVIAQSMVMSGAGKLEQDGYSDLLSGITTLSQHMVELQEAVMSVRMQPVKTVFSRIPRMLHDLNRKLGKNIILETYGESTELDKTVIERLTDPLIHMIRNSADHGIEATEEERIAQGKPAQGRIILNAEHSGGKIIISIEDDGAGINREKVLAKAIEKGLVSEHADMSPSDIDRLVFLPGFSTANEVSDVSGRGVGMDVVKKNIEALGGLISMASTPGKGTTFNVTLPLTLAILDGMIIRTGEEMYVIPISNIIETLHINQEHIHDLPSGLRTISVRGDYLPLIDLSSMFGIPKPQNSSGQELAVIVESGRKLFGINVDAIEGQQQVVIKSLEENFTAVTGISAATILGDGKVSLILDVGALEQCASEYGSRPLYQNKPSENSTLLEKACHA